MPKTVKRRKNKLAGRYRNRWPDEAEISGRMIPKWVADSCRNRWPDHPEICNVERVPLIQFDFEHLSEEEQAFAALYDIPLALVKALSMVLNAQLHIPEQSGHRFRHYPDSHSAINRTLILR